MTFDFVVIGAGSGGCAVGSRLSENGKYRVDPASQKAAANVGTMTARPPTSGVLSGCILRTPSGKSNRLRARAIGSAAKQIAMLATAAANMTTRIKPVSPISPMSRVPSCPTGRFKPRKEPRCRFRRFIRGCQRSYPNYGAMHQFLAFAADDAIGFAAISSAAGNGPRARFATE